MSNNYSQMGSAAGGLVGGPIGAGIGALVGGGISAIQGAIQKKEGRALINKPRPVYEIPNEVVQAASEGLPSEQYAQAMRNIKRQQSMAVSQAQDRRGGLMSITKTNQIANDANLNLDVQNANARMKNQQRLATYRDKAFDYNVTQPYERNFNYGMNLLGAGNQNFTNGLDKFGAGIGLLAGGGSMFGKKNSGIGSAGQALDNTYGG